MKNKLFALLFSLLAFHQLPALSQLTAKDAWLSMPDSLLPYLSKTMRSDHIDFLKINVESQVKNLLGGKGVMDTLTTDFLSLRLNDNVTLQLKVLPTVKGDSIICWIKTFAAPAKDSEIRFYRSDWQPLQGTYGLPNFSDAQQLLDDFTSKPDTMSLATFDELKSMIDPVMLSASLLVGETAVELTISPIALTKNDELKLKAILKQKKFKWDGTIFKEY